MNTPSIVRSLAFLFALSLIGCAHPLKKYGMASTSNFPVSKDGYYLIPGGVESSTPYGSFKTNTPIRIKSISIDDRVIADTVILQNAVSFKKLIKSGTDSAVIYYRNYLTSCCDGWSAGSFVIYLGLSKNGYDLSKSFISEIGSISPPHATWYPKLIKQQNDSLLNIIAYPSRSDSLHPVYFEIWNMGKFDSTFAEYDKSLEEIKMIAGEKY